MGQKVKESASKKSEQLSGESFKPVEMKKPKSTTPSKGFPTIQDNSWQLLLRPDAQTLDKDAFKRKSPKPREANPRVNKILRHEENMRNDRGCPRCPPHGGENAGRSSPSVHGAKKKKKGWKK